MLVQFPMLSSGPKLAGRGFVGLGFELFGVFSQFTLFGS